MVNVIDCTEGVSVILVNVPVTISVTLNDLCHYSAVT